MDSRQGFIQFSRPANTTAYAANDLVGNATSANHEIPNMLPKNGLEQCLLIKTAQLTINAVAVPSGMSGFRVHIYTAAPPAAVDNDAWGLAYANIANYAGYFDLPAPTVHGSVLYSQSPMPIDLEIEIPANATILYARLQTLGAYTPASATSHTLKLLAVALD